MFDGLPDELLHNIVKYLHTKSLKQLSPVSQAWHKVIHPELFSILSLADLSAAQVEELHNNLFTTCDTHGRPSLKGTYVRRVKYSFIESDLDEQELRHKLAVSNRIFHALKGMSVLEIEISLVEEDSKLSEVVFLPAIEEFVNTIRDKVTSIEIRFDVEGSMAFLDEEADSDHKELTRKVSHICAILPPSLVTSLSFVDAGLTSLPQSLERLLGSPALKRLSLQDCNESLTCLPRIPNLEDLSVSWGGEDVETCAMRAAFEISRNSATTLKSLRLQNVLSQDAGIPPGWSSILHLPTLTRLHLSDSHVGPGSPFEIIFSHTFLPGLRTLILDVEDILESAYHVNEALGQLSNLQLLKLVENGRRPDPRVESLLPGPYHFLERSCRERGIRLQGSVSTRCTTPFELTYEIMRLEEMASILTHVGLSCQTSVQQGIDDLPYVHLPNARRLVLGFSSPLARGVPDVHGVEERLVSPPYLKKLLEHLDCPDLRTLQLNVSIKDGAGAKIIAELEGIVTGGIFPSLERITGALLAAPDMFTDDLEALKEPIIIACREKTIDSAGFKFICRNERCRSQQSDSDDDDDDSDVSDESEEHSGLCEEDENSVNSSEDIDDSQSAGSDNGESGFAEAPTAMILRSCESSSASDADDQGYVPDDKSVRSPGTSEDSWLTDEDEILAAFTRPAR